MIRLANNPGDPPQPHVPFMTSLKNAVVKVVALMVLIFVGMGIENYTQSWGITGKWRGTNPADGILEFQKNGTLLMTDHAGKTFGADSDIKVTWEVVDEVSPPQIYAIATSREQSVRMPLGIYKVENGKLIIRSTKDYYNTIGGIPLGLSRQEMPTDFSGVVSVYERIY
jgi:hypothetical protein